MNVYIIHYDTQSYKAFLKREAAVNFKLNQLVEEGVDLPLKQMNKLAESFVYEVDVNCA